MWIIRAGLVLLIPPFFTFELPIGYLVVLPFNGSDHPAAFLGFIGYIVSVCIVSGVAFGIYGGTSFEISPTSVAHNLNFLWSKRKEVLLVNIKEVELKIGLLQKLFGLGTVLVHTQASAADNTKPGLSLFDIKNPDKVYEALKENISKAARV